MSSPREIRRTLGWLLVASLCVAALTAIVAILTDSFDDDDWRIIGTSLALTVFGSTASAGAALRLRTAESLRTLGVVTVALSAAAFVLFVIALWNDDSDTAWKSFGVAGLGAFSASHGSVVVGARRERDSEAIRLMVATSIVLSVVFSGLGILGIVEALDDVGDAFARFFGVLVVLFLLTTVLPPILRRLQQGSAGARLGEGPRGEAAPPPAAETRAPSAPAPLATEVIAAVDRILALDGEPEDRSAEIRQECERLRELARSYSR